MVVSRRRSDGAGRSVRRVSNPGVRDGRQHSRRHCPHQSFLPGNGFPPAEMSSSMKITVVGCGYLGAVHAASMAELGHDVVGIDVDERKVASLSRAEAPFYEPGFVELLGTSLASGRLRFSTDIAEGAGARVYF